MPIETCWSEQYFEFSFAGRVLYYLLAAGGKRCFYYAPFSATTGAIIASGFGYNGVKKSEKGEEIHRWDKVVGVYWYECETVASPVEFMRYWNHQIHVWLKYYVKDRLVEPGQKAGPYDAPITFMVCAAWHGFYPSYYVVFVSAALLFELSKDVYKARSLLNFIPEQLRYYLAWLAGRLLMNYLFTSIMGYENGYTFLRANYYYGHVVIIGGLLISRGLGLT